MKKEKALNMLVEQLLEENRMMRDHMRSMETQLQEMAKQQQEKSDLLQTELTELRAIIEKAPQP